MAFDPQQHIMKQQGKDYLEVKWRLVWFKDVYAERGAISTDVISFDPLVVKAAVLVDGVTVATGHGSANAGERKVVWNGRELEKAETAAIGRALAHAGFGTQFTGEVESIADSPVERTSNRPAPIHPARAVQPPKVIEPTFDEQFPKSAEPDENPFPVTVEKVKVHKPPSGKQYLELLPGGVLLWTRQPFRDLGIECETWTEANSVYTLPEPLRAFYKVDGTLKKFTRLEKVAA